jgi:hypothetical protein
MSKAEKLISDCTRNCSNEIFSPYPQINKDVLKIGGEPAKEFSPWLTPDQARKAVEIAREEMIEKFICWLKDNFRDDAGLCCIISDFDTTKEMYGDLKQSMKDE